MNAIRKYLLMEEHVCPSWLYFSLNTVLRKMIHNPVKMLSPFVGEGQTALDLGCGPGFFTFGLAEIVGKNGKVLAVDIQRKAIERIGKRIRNTDLEGVVIPLLATPSDISVRDKADFVLAFWMVHEVPDKEAFFDQITRVMKQQSLFLMVEPKLHVSDKKFIEEVKTAESRGMELMDFPCIGLSRSALFRRRAHEAM
jgi:ubiquinone/menaquinone biosynthesis C-methylase UbiE